MYEYYKEYNVITYDTKDEENKFVSIDKIQNMHSSHDSFQKNTELSTNNHNSKLLLDGSKRSKEVYKVISTR